MLLGWPGVEIVGITTTVDPAGTRAGCVGRCLELAGREGIALAAGAAASLTTLRGAEPATGDVRYWPADVQPAPSLPGAALDLLARSIEQRATVLAIGPLTNLALLEVCRPGILGRTRVVAMAGWIAPPARGLPAWGPEMDFNVQWDTRAAQIVAASADLTLVPLAVTLKAHLRARDLPRLRASGPLGRLLAEQSQARCSDGGMRALARAHPALPDDLLNFHYDPLACAVALGWPGAVIETMPLTPVADDHVLRFRRDDHGRPTRVAADLDAEAFPGTWLAAVEAAQDRR